VIPFDCDDGNSSVLQKLKARERVVHRLRINIAAVEEVARDEHEVNTVRHRVAFDNVVPTVEKILRALFEIVSAAAEVYVREV
jgi:hypothetical protein